MRAWRRRQAEPDPEPGRTLSDADVHQLALGAVIAAADANEDNVRMLLADLGPADLIEVTGDVAAFAVAAFKISDADWGPERVRRAFQHLAFLQASQ
jgi:hypothetical protein